MTKLAKIQLFIVVSLIFFGGASSASAATQIFRSVGPSATSALATGSASNTLTISSGTATFSAPLSDNVGVGDVIQYNISGTYYVAFIHGRSSSTSFTVASSSGGTPTTATLAQAWNIYRAYTSLYNAESGDENDTLNDTVENFDSFSGGKDITSSDEEWNITCYANGTTADTTAVTIDGWTTDSDNFIKIYTPFEKDEVGVSQRHEGIWSLSDYRMDIASGNGISVNDQHVKIEGLQIDMRDTTSTGVEIHTAYGAGTDTFLEVSSCIIWGNSGTYASGINFEEVDLDYGYAYNNIVYDFTGTQGNGIIAWGAAGGSLYFYNNTVYNCTRGIGEDDANTATVSAKNNLVQSSATGFLATFDSSSTNNITEQNAQDGAFGTNADSGTTTGTTTSKLVDSTQNFLTTVRKGMVIANTTDSTYTYVTSVESNTQLAVSDDIFVSGENYTIYTNMYGAVTFAYESNDNFHLSSVDQLAQNNGANLSADSNLPLSKDVDNHTRVLDWDIGSDQREPTEFISIIDPDDGTGTDYTSLFSWEQNNQTNLATTSTKAFNGQYMAGSIADTDTVTLYRGGNSLGITADVVHGNVGLLLLENISNPVVGFEYMDQWRVDASNYFTFYEIRDSAISIAQCRSTGGSADTTAVTIDGWTTSPTNYIKIWTDPDDAYGRHNGVWDEGKYRMSINSAGSIFNVEENYTYFAGLQLEGISGNTNQIFSLSSNSQNTKIDNCIMRKNGGGGTSNSGITCDNSAVYVYITNNIIYNIPQTAIVDGFSSGDYYYIYNNTIINCGTGFNLTDSGRVVLKNNIVQDCGTDYSGIASSSSSNNISSDGTAPGTNSKSSTTVKFLDATNNDFHLDPTDTSARNAGTSSVALGSSGITGALRDIDGTARGNAYDIGADEVPTEFVSTICENTSAGGDCNTDMDYNTLASWEDAVESDLTASTTRVFSGSITGTLNENNTLDVYVGGSDTNIDVTVVATTSDQILVDNIVGTSTPLNVASGTQFRLFGATTNMWTVTGTNDELGASPIAIAKIDGAWGSADTDMVTIDDWGGIDDTMDGDNYAKIYTTSLARHNGKWDDTKYRLEVVGEAAMRLYQMVKIDGLQIKITPTAANSRAILSRNFDAGTIQEISNCIIKGVATTSYETQGIYSNMSGIKVYNNIIYNFQGYLAFGQYWSAAIKDYTGSDIVYAYNNIIYNCDKGLLKEGSSFVAKNNLIASTTDPFYGTFHASSTNNASDSSDTPTGASNTITNADINFVSTASGTEDFHLLETSTDVINAGADLSADEWIPASAGMTRDIDGAERDPDGLGFDIGADEVPVAIFRSVGPSATTALTNDGSHARTVTLTSGTATFSTALADNIGVGDAVLIDTGGTDQTIDASDTLLFIHARTDSTHYTLRTENGAVPSDIAVNDTYAVYRAYTSLANAEAGTINTTISGLGFSFTGGNRDLVANNEQWNIACYSDATDTTAVTIDGWDTGAQNYIRIYTPVGSSEVGISQRHSGKWDEGKYQVNVTITYDYENAIQIQDEYVEISGLQVSYTNSAYISSRGILVNNVEEGGTGIYISNNIVRGYTTGSATGGGIYTNYLYLTDVSIFNNIVYGVNGNCIRAEGGGNGAAKVYNNTTSNCGYGISGSYNAVILMNNISQNNTYDYSIEAYDADYNISSDATAPGTNSQTNTTVSFVDAVGKDFHLAPDDTSAIDAGADISIDANLAFTHDIDGHLRTQWDIGADEASIDFDPTVMQTGGDYSTLASWEAGIQTDLTADTTRVFSHSGITGTILDTDSVTGATSGATADVVHATDNGAGQQEILLENISGTFESGEQIQVDGSNYVTISNNGNPANAVAKIDGAWSSPDTTAVSISGWTTGANNYIKIYTTDSARHQGKWDEGKYRLEFTASADWQRAFSIYENNNTKIDGLQIAVNNNGHSWNYGIFYGDNHYQYISNNIIKGVNNDTGGTIYGISSSNSSAANIHKTFIWNNIIYDFNLENSFGIHVDWLEGGYLYNNTIYDCQTAFGGNFSAYLAKNNIAQNCLTTCYENSDFVAGSTNNLSDDGSADDDSNMANSIINTSVQFLDADNDDFHLDVTDTVAKDAGADLSNDSWIPASAGMTRDIDGDSRHDTGWDIGADEAPARIYRSVGPSNTSALDDDNLGTETLSISSSTATFSAAIADNVGVGDAIVYDSDGDDDIDSDDSIVFIHGRTDSTHYTVKSADGSWPENVVTGEYDWEIYRAYTSLSNAEAGTINSAISTIGLSFTGGNRDLVANNEQWNIACYGDAVDGSPVVIDGWTTSANNYIRIYTPYLQSEVGASERHDGKWNDSAYHIGANSMLIDVRESDVIIEGLQLDFQWQQTYSAIALNSNASGTENITIRDNIFRYTGSTSYGGAMNLGLEGGTTQAGYVYNNIAYDFPENCFYAISITDNTYVSNNTAQNCGVGFEGHWSVSTVLKNNLAQDCVDGYADDFDASSDYNISDIAGDTTGISGSYRSGLATDVLFADETNNDFHLSGSDTSAMNQGTDLSADANLPFWLDIDGETRAYGVAWDIGADEATKINTLIKGGVEINGGVRIKKE